METNQASGALNIAVTAAREAGTIIVQNIDQVGRLKVSKKDRDEFVSEVDIHAEQAIIKVIEKHFPEHNIVGEESGDHGRQNEYCWVIDPLDGTHNYLHSHPHCAVSIALQKNGESTLAVVYDPFRNELFTAISGRGAQLDSRRIRISEISKLSESMLCTGFGTRQLNELKPRLRTFANILPRAQSIHRTGSSVLDLAYVACGRYDGFWKYQMNPWDIAAGGLLVVEAGGILTDLAGIPGISANGDQIAATPKLHEKLLHLVSHSNK